MAIFDQLVQAVAQRGIAFGQELVTWMTTVQAHAIPKWGPIVAAQIACSKAATRGRPCQRQALAKCIVCFDVVCLEHAVISPTADVACTACMHRMAKRAIDERDRAAEEAEARAQATDPREVRQWLEVLGLREGATEEDIARAHKKLSAKWHPDRFRDGTREKVEALRIYKHVQEARDFLIKHGTGERAA